MSTPHLETKKGEFAETVLMPGDPLRSKFIADSFLEDVTMVNTVRNMLAYTGYYKGVKVSTMGSGIGIPSCVLYAKELVTEYGVKKLIRVGSCGGIAPEIKVRDVIIAHGASTDSNVNRMRFNNYDYSATADYNLLVNAVKAANKNSIDIHIGNIFTSDFYYHPDPNAYETMDKMGSLAVEMETAGLYGLASEYKVKALSILTVSDHIITGESTTSEEREKTFGDMIKIALESLL